MKIMDNLKKNFIKKEPLLYYYMDGQAAAHKSMKAQNGGGPKGGWWPFGRPTFSPRPTDWNGSVCSYLEVELRAHLIMLRS